MPTPPKESIRGTKGHQIAALDFAQKHQIAALDFAQKHQIAALDFAQKQFEYIVEVENFIESKDFQELPELERSYILSEVEQQNYAYENLRLRVESY